MKDLEICKKIGDISGEGSAYGNLGNVYHSLGDYQQSSSNYEACIQIIINLNFILATKNL